MNMYSSMHYYVYKKNFHHQMCLILSVQLLWSSPPPCEQACPILSFIFIMLKRCMDHGTAFYGIKNKNRPTTVLWKTIVNCAVVFLYPYSSSLTKASVCIVNSHAFGVRLTHFYPFSAYSAQCIGHILALDLMLYKISKLTGVIYPFKNTYSMKGG